MEEGVAITDGERKHFDRLLLAGVGELERSRLLGWIRGNVARNKGI